MKIPSLKDCMDQLFNAPPQLMTREAFDEALGRLPGWDGRHELMRHGGHQGYPDWMEEKK